MLKKIILLLLICCIAIAGFAQKNRKKSTQKSPKSSYFMMLINGQETPAERYCPNDSIEFDFMLLDTTIKEFTYCWRDNFFMDSICDITPIKIAFPPDKDDDGRRVLVSIYFRIQIDTVEIRDTITHPIYVDYIRTELDTTVCQGRDITISTITHGDITFYDVQGEQHTPYDTLQSVSGCDSLVRWNIIMEPYILLEYKISSCDSVIWGDTIVKRPDDLKGDSTWIVKRIFFAEDPDFGCDTMIVLNITIIDTAQLDIIFDQIAFCDGEDMGGEISLETNFTAFDWTYLDKDSLFTVFEKSIDIEYPGYYHVLAYMDTSLYDTLPDLRIVNCFLMADTLVEDCPLVIPNVITPGGNSYNDVLGIKKLNPVRENELTIYDRWGKNVFRQKNYQCIYKNKQYLNKEDAFEGLSRGGQKLPDGTYYYAFKYAAIPENKTYTGIITIIWDIP